MALLGKPFRDYVKTQIDKREEALGKGPTIGSNNDVSKTFFQNVPWIRLSSGVDLTNEEIIKTRSMGEVTFTPQPTPIDNTFVTNPGERLAQVAEIQQILADAGFPVPGSNEETEGLTPEEEASILGISLDELNTTTTSPQNNIPQPPQQNNTPPPFPTTTTIPISGSVLDKLVERGYNENEIKGAELAKHFVLFGGVISQENSSIQRYSGLSGNRWGGAYGFGLPSDILKERGYVPMPGIESVDFSYKNDGALAQATVKIKCYSRSQFEIIDVLYMRPGYTVLLEFGHSVFIGNNNNVARAGEGDYSFYTEPFLAMGGKVSFSDLKSKILNEKEKWNGNYEGFYAKITKFNWSFSNNVYDITINLVGFGDVISSLNATPSPSLEVLQDILNLKNVDNEAIEESETAIVSQALKSSLNTKLFILYLKAGGEIKARRGTVDERAPRLFGLNMTQEYGTGKALYPKGMKYKSYDENTKKIKLETFRGSFPLSLFQVFNVKNRNQRDAYYPNMYISFGAFCAILQNEINLFTKNKEFLINIDINYANLSEDKNIMRVFPGMFSADPSKVIIPYLPHQGHTDTSVLREIAQLALDRIFIRNPYIDSEIDNTFKLISILTTDLSPIFYIDNNKGRLAHVLLDMAYLSDVVSSNINKNEKTLTISPLKILEDILSTINETTGGVNEFKVIEDADTGFTKIISEVPQDDNDVLKSINSYGFTGNNFLSTNIRGSFVKSLNLSSELSDAFATQISVGAQNNSSQQGGNGASFSEYNKGLIDRIIPEKLSTNPEIENQDPPETLNGIANKEVYRLIKLLYKPKRYTYEWSPETISSVLAFNKNYASLLTGINAKKQYAPTPFYIPFNLSLDLLGLGGLRIYDGFKFDGKVLPISYQPESIKLIIKSLSHNVSVDGWTTKVETLAQPIAKLIKPENTVPSINLNISGVGDSSPCNQFKNEPYDVTAGGSYPNLRKLKFTGQDPRTGLTFQGIPLSAFSKLMTSGDGADLPKAGYGVARKAFEQLQIIGDEASKKGLTGLTINSHYRSPVYNCQIGGVPNSMHKTGGAIDIGTTNSKGLYDLIESLISQNKILEGGVGLYNTFVHYDIRGTYARW